MNPEVNTRHNLLPLAYNFFIPDKEGYYILFSFLLLRSKASLALPFARAFPGVTAGPLQTLPVMLASSDDRARATFAEVVKGD